MPFRPDVDAIADLIRDTAQEEILPRFRNLAHAEISEKDSPGDLVTIADEATEKSLSLRLAELTPSAVIVGEEAASKNPALLDALAQADEAWIIDPIDGTLNFAAGIPLFAVMLAYARKGQVKMAWLYDPVLGESVTAEEGGGAWLNGRRLKTSTPSSLAHMSGVVSLRFGPRDAAMRIAENLPKIASLIMLRSAGQEYLTMAQGRIDFTLYRKTLPWDHAPGSLIIREAGGVSRWLDGRDYHPGDAKPGKGLLSAASAESWDWLRQDLIG